MKAVPFDVGNPGGIITPVLEAAQAVKDNGKTFAFAKIANDTAHV
jgi:hypothetical protein